MNQQAQQQQQQQHLMYMPKELALPEAIQEWLPESLLFKQLQELEYRLDHLLEEKKKALREYYQRNQQLQKRTLRIFVFSTLQQQGNFTLHIQGHFVNEHGQTVADKFTQHVKRVIIELDKINFASVAPVEWERHSNFQDTGSLCQQIIVSLF